VIVGFPGETREDFEQTLSLIEEVEFVSLFTFIFSPRKGTPAEKMEDPTPAQVKTAWFKEMTDLQEKIAAKRQAMQVGKRYRALIESAKDGYLEARLQDNTVVRVNGKEDRIGEFADVVITSARSWICVGEFADENS
jgi:tRNA-2-methylthio-N6-dimethylallyladenosine synthase